MWELCPPAGAGLHLCAVLALWRQRPPRLFILHHLRRSPEGADSAHKLRRGRSATCGGPLQLHGREGPPHQHSAPAWSDVKDFLLRQATPSPDCAWKMAPPTAEKSTQTVGLYYPSATQMQKERERALQLGRQRDRQPPLTSVSPGKGTAPHLRPSRSHDGDARLCLQVTGGGSWTTCALT